MEKRQGKVTSPAGRVGGDGIGSRKGRGPTQWGGPAQSSSTRRAPILTITKSSTSHTVLFHLKRFPRTKQVFKPLLYHLKRFRGTKLRFISNREKRQGKATETGNRDSPAGRVGGAGIGSRKGRGPTPVGRTGAVQLHPPGAHTHNY